jgi:4-hydroxy-2-oxoglutarate aldolase
MRFAGVYPPIATPFDSNGEVDHMALRSNVERWNGTGLAGYVAFGSNGENVFMDESEKLAVLRTVVAAASKGKQVIAGTGCESTRETIRLSRLSVEAGAHAVLVVTPHYYKLPDKRMEAYFRDVADACPAPVLLYNVPKFTNVNMSADLVAKLSTHPNIQGVKDSSGNVPQLADILRRVRPDFAVLAGTASILYAACALGAVGGIVALANVAPRESVRIVETALAGKHAESRDLQMKMFPVNEAITATYGVPGLKAAMDMVGYKGGFPRKPLMPAEDTDREAIRRILAAAGLPTSAQA